MHNTISQLQSEFSEDIIKVDGKAEQNARNPELMKAIEDQVDTLGKKLCELLNEINEMKNKPIKKPNDEIKFWKSKGAKLNKAYKLTQDDRVTVLIDSLELQWDHNKDKDRSTLDYYKKQKDEL